MRYVQRISGIEGVANSGNARLKIPLNRRVHQMVFKTTIAGVASVASDVIDTVRLFVNGVTIIDLTAADLLKIAAANGQTVTDGVLPINFSEPYRADKIDEQITALDLFGEDSCELEFVFKNPVGGAVGLTGRLIFDYGQTLIDGKVSKNVIKKYVVARNSASGTNDFDNIPTKDPIQRITLLSATGVSDVEVTADGAKVHESDDFSNQAIVSQHGITSSPTAYVVAFDFTERIDDALAVRNLNLRYTAAAAEQCRALVEARVGGYY